jgi:hypothetical protein
MKGLFPRTVALLTLAALVALATPALAESAYVGTVDAAGNVQLYLNRFRSTFADGTPVARVEAKTTDGYTRVYRWAADGCRGESTLLKIGDGALGGDLHPVWLVTAHPLDLYRCEDRGCAEEFTDQLWTAACGDFDPIKCMCIRKKGDLVTGEQGDWCKRILKGSTVWDLGSWTFPQFIQ